MAVTAPRHLTPASRKLFRRLVEDYDLASEPHAIRVLTLTLEASDRCDAARLVIERDGPTFIDRFDQPKPRPEVAVERDSRIAVMRGFRELSLSLDGDTDTGDVRVPRVGGGRS